MTFVNFGRHRIAQLGGQHPVVALVFEQLADYGFGRACGVHVSGVDVVHAVGICISGDARGLGAIRLVAKHHRAQAQG